MLDSLRKCVIALSLGFTMTLAIGCGGGGSSETTVNEPAAGENEVLGGMSEEEMNAQMEKEMGGPGGN